MRIPLYQIDAFSNGVFTGNPAAVCPLAEWPDDSLLQSIAHENNLSETAFFIPEGEGYHLRWFTPVAEIHLCGHATLAAAFVIFSILGHPEDRITFSSLSGALSVQRSGDLLEMDFPAQPPMPCDAPPELLNGLGRTPLEIHRADDYLAVFSSEDEVLALKPDMSSLKRLDLRGVIVTAPGSASDFVSRFFAPKLGIDEDPVTGSAHCVLIPYWSRRLGKRELFARQLSQRGGDLFCTDLGSRVSMAGLAVKFMEGVIEV